MDAKKVGGDRQVGDNLLPAHGVPYLVSKDQMTEKATGRGRQMCVRSERVYVQMSAKFSKCSSHERIPECQVPQQLPDLVRSQPQ